MSKLHVHNGRLCVVLSDAGGGNSGHASRFPAKNPPVTMQLTLVPDSNEQQVHETSEQDDALIAAIKLRATLFVRDNFENPGPREQLLIENAMLVGASVAFEQDQPRCDVL